MIAGIYARKSTKQEKASEEAKSVPRQIALAREFTDRQKWTVDERYIFADDGISGGIFDPKKRPGLPALLEAARSRPRPFDVLVIMNQSRLARRQRYTVDIVHDLTDAGVRIFHYQTGLERKMETATDRFMVPVEGFSDEAYRESVRITTRETMRRKAERGEVAGGKVYGYDNRRTPMGYVARVINEDHKKALIRMWEMATAGLGFVRIGKTFNQEAVPSPGGRGWSPSAIRGETKVKVKLPPEKRVRVEKPEVADHPGAALAGRSRTHREDSQRVPSDDRRAPVGSP